MSRARIWAPFLCGFVGGVLFALASIPVARFFGLTLIWFPKLTLYSGWPVLLVTGPAVGFVAAGLSRTWRGVLALLLGFAAAGTVLGLIWIVGGVRRDIVEVVLEAALYVTLSLGLLGVPTYLIVAGTVQLVDRRREPRRSERG